MEYRPKIKERFNNNNDYNNKNNNYNKNNNTNNNNHHNRKLFFFKHHNNNKLFCRARLSHRQASSWRLKEHYAYAFKQSLNEHSPTSTSFIQYFGKRVYNIYIYIYIIHIFIDRHGGLVVKASAS